MSRTVDRPNRGRTTDAARAARIEAALRAGSATPSRPRPNGRAPATGARRRGAAGDRNAERAGQRAGRPSRSHQDRRPAPAAPARRPGRSGAARTGPGRRPEAPRPARPIRPDRTAARTQAARQRTLAARQRAARRPARRWRTGRPQRRLIVVFSACALVLVLMVLRVAMLQTVNRSTYAAYGESKRLSTVTLTASRGTIYDRNRLELAISAPQKTIWADPRLVLAPNVADPEGNLEQLAAALNLSPFAKADLRQRLNIPKKDFAYVARQVDDATADRVLALKLPGIFAYAEPKRFNPGDLALSTVGHTDIDGQRVIRGKEFSNFKLY